MTADTPQMLQAGEHPYDVYAALQVRLESTYALGDQLADELANLLADGRSGGNARALTAWFEHRNPETDDDGD